MRAKRTNIDFSNHELIITKQDNLLIHFLKQPNTYTNCIKYINTNDIMAITGDFGNWIFCREFHPSKDGYVSDYYWIEKLKNSSDQTGLEYDSESTYESLNEMLNGGIEEYGYKDEQIIKIKQYFEECLNYIDDEIGYKYFAYREHPYFMDSESVIYKEKINIWLQYIFDGFDEICNRLN